MIRFLKDLFGIWREVLTVDPFGPIQITGKVQSTKGLPRDPLPSEIILWKQGPR